MTEQRNAKLLKLLSLCSRYISLSVHDIYRRFPPPNISEFQFQ